MFSEKVNLLCALIVNLIQSFLIHPEMPLCVSSTPILFKLPVITHERELLKIVFPPGNA